MALGFYINDLEDFILLFIKKKELAMARQSELGTVDYNREQQLVDEYFDKCSQLWDDIIQRKDAIGIVNQLRQTITLRYVDKLSLPKTARILEIGCGAGGTTIAIARRGFAVEAVDHSSAMIELTKRHIKENGMENKIHLAIDDVHKLSFNDQSFDLIIALGVVGWLHDLKKALIEIKRVLKPGGYAILNSTHAHAILNPLSIPLIESFFRARERWAIRNSQHKTVTPHFYLAKEFNQHLSEINLNIVEYTIFGFGPFIVINHKLFPDHVEKKIQQKLQRYADARLPIIRSAGTQNIVLARKVTQKKVGHQRNS
jgi:ubiquinone/menaquinone biosynthesis C-methylase UbiE